ncbi:MAG TPA: RNA polymerase factor sigma-54 [Ktedonobacterales bacterium]|jgi:RNA polymerase sigma-54 factor
MFLKQDPSIVPQTSLNISAKLIASIKILQLSAEELEQLAAVEVRDNPAFEMEEVSQCQCCGTQMKDGICPNCGTTAGSRAENTPEWEDYNEPGVSSSEEDDYDPLARVESLESLEESLLSHMRTMVSPDDFPIAEYLIWNLDSHGYLQVSVEEAAWTLRVALEQVLHVLDILQMQEPVGIGARDLRECLLIQLRWFRELGSPQPLAEKLVDKYLNQLGEHRFAEIAREVHAPGSHVRQAWQFIRTNLTPFPAHVYDASASAGAGARAHTTLVRPDVVIRRVETGFEAEVVENKKYLFRLNPTYNHLAKHLDRQQSSEEERQHIRHYTSRAQFFIDCIHQRWETLKKISDALVEYQCEFLEKGVRYLVPLTRGELAQKVGLHESTISRATANKFVLLPEGRTIPFDEFFDGSLRAKDTLRELIASEDPRHPLSDEELAAELAERGLVVARRTVAKYRESLRILPSRLRV